MKTAQSGLSRRPFIAEPLPEGYCPFGSAEDSRKKLIRCIDRQEGIGLVIGLSGTGKTLLCRRLNSDFRDQMDTLYLNSNNLKTPKVLFQGILSQIAVSYRRLDLSELRLAVLQSLQDSTYFPSGLLILLDDAQDISLRVFEELRQILDVSRPPVNGVRLVLFGNMGLDEKFALPQLDSFVQRITTRCSLETLNRDETVAFLRQELREAGWDENLFSRDVCREIYKFSDGVPRRTNQLADHILVLAEENPGAEINPAFVQKAWRSLQQFPDISDDNISQEYDSLQDADRPEEVSAMKSNADSLDSVEFGSLDDDLDSDLDFISESKPANDLDSDLDSDPEHTIDFENSENTENSGFSGDDEPTQIWSRGSVPGAVGVSGDVPENLPDAEASGKYLKRTREITFFQEAPDGSPQPTSKSVGEIPDNDDWDMRKDTLEKQVTTEKKSENSPYSAQKPGTEKNSVLNTPAQNFATVLPRSAGNSGSNQTEATLVLSELDRLIFQSYLEETTQSFGRLYRILEAMRADFSTPQAEDFSPEFWTEMHNLSQSSISNLAHERMARWNSKQQPLEKDSAQEHYTHSGVPVTRYSPESILEEGSVSPTTLSLEADSQETFIRQDSSHPVPATQNVKPEAPEGMAEPDSRHACSADDLEDLRRAVQATQNLYRNIPPELQARAQTIIDDLKMMDEPEGAHAD